MTDLRAALNELRESHRFIRRKGFPEHRGDAECYCDTCWSYGCEEAGGDPEREPVARDPADLWTDDMIADVEADDRDRMDGRAVPAMTSERAALTGAELIAAERERQLRPKAEGGEGWDAEHDRGHEDELAMAAATYAMPEDQREQIVGNDFQPITWPWHIKYWKPTPEDRIRELTKAGALIAAAIDSLREEQR